MVDVQRRIASQRQKDIDTGVRLAVDRNNFATINSIYNQLPKRRLSFKNLPIWEVSRPGCNPSMLAEAGLYYEVENNQGHYKCFRCSLTETSWPFQNDPFIEHKNRSPNCSYIREELANRKKQGLVKIEDSDEDVDEFNENVNAKNNISENRLESDCVDSGSQSGEVLKTDAPLINKSNPTSTNGQIKSRNINKNKTERDRLRQDIRRLKNCCRQCKTGMLETLFLPCRHLVTCEECADKMKDCIICQAEILGTARVYFG